MMFSLLLNLFIASTQAVALDTTKDLTARQDHAGSWSSTPTPTSTPALAPTGTVPDGYLQVSGTNFVNASGSPITLHGVNLGGWLVIEDWMCGIADTTDDSGDHPFRQSLRTLTNRFGQTNALNLINTWQQNFISAQDFVDIKSLGFNLIRLPFSYLTLLNDDGSWRSDAYDLLDWAVEQARLNDIYIILDLHVWSTQQQNYALISSASSAGSAARTPTQTLWQNITAHYLGNPTIAAFDILNEPTGSYANYLQRDLYASIRSVDPDKILILESFSAPPEKYAFEQVVYSFHEYALSTPSDSLNEAIWQANRTTIEEYLSYPVPFYMGEFSATNADEATLQYLLGEMNDLGIAWSMWTWKAVDQGDWAFQNYPHYPVTYRVNINADSYESILETWRGLSAINATWNANLTEAYAGYI